MARVTRLGSAVAGGAVVLALAAYLGTPAAWAQKNSGPLLPTSPPPARPAPPYAAPPRPVPPVGPQVGSQGANPDAARLAQTLPIDPQTRALENQEPPDPRATQRQLGLREPRGQATDMRGRTPSPREIVNALAPR